MPEQAWTTRALDVLAERPAWGYRAASTPATEPTALACLALAAQGRATSAVRAARWLAEQQADDGRLGVTALEKSPHWPTALAVLAWRGVDQRADFERAVARGVAAILQAEGRVVDKLEHMGHDPTLKGWPWVAETHAWLEPTAWQVLALRAAGQRDHPRTRVGARLIVDRLLSGGGCNYGNTTVLGQELRPHLQPSGLALLVLADDPPDDPRLARTLDYVATAVTTERATASLCYGVLGLAAHRRRPTAAEDLLAAAAERVLSTDKSPLQLALLCLAAAPGENPIIHTPAKTSA